MVVRTSGDVGAARRGAEGVVLRGDCIDVPSEGVLNSGRDVSVAIERDHLGARHCYCHQ